MLYFLKLNTIMTDLIHLEFWCVQETHWIFQSFVSCVLFELNEWNSILWFDFCCHPSRKGFANFFFKLLFPIPEGGKFNWIVVVVVVVVDEIQKIERPIETLKMVQTDKKFFFTWTTKLEDRTERNGEDQFKLIKMVLIKTILYLQ